MVDENVSGSTSEQSQIVLGSPIKVRIVSSGVVAVGDVEGAEVCRQLERGGHKANKAGQEQQQVEHQHQYHRHHKIVQVKVEVDVEQEQC